MLETAFWKSAAASLPAAVRERYRAEFVQAERWDLALDAAIELFKACLTVRALPKPPPPLAR